MRYLMTRCHANHAVPADQRIISRRSDDLAVAATYRWFRAWHGKYMGRGIEYRWYVSEILPDGKGFRDVANGDWRRPT